MSIEDDTLNKSTERVHHIINEYLGMRKPCAKWVPRELTFDQKQRRVDDSEKCLKMIKHSKPDPIGSHPSGLHTTNPLQGVGKRNSVLARSWDAHRIICIDYLEKGRTTNSDYYIASLNRLKDKIEEKRSNLKKKKVLLRQDNALCHKSVKTMAKIHELGFELIPNPSYSPDQAPSVYFLFSDLKRMLAGKKFSSNEEVIAETEAYFEAKSKSYYKNGIEKLEGHYNQCITLEGNFVE
ncbi:hypothetical protein GWI33_020303 [Rhynchophorus ferrugineus]|uniref:Transposase n=1 Tax=Rhynchophorus ferrugineus TaxID=354439 RepID=A0A834HPJ6_RHYFE|nr:hypothetical protein GWI33_020303 [Rhynchophorus ferrugineus]